MTYEEALRHLLDGADAVGKDGFAEAFQMAVDALRREKVAAAPKPERIDYDALIYRLTRDNNDYWQPEISLLTTIRDFVLPELRERSADQWGTYFEAKKTAALIHALETGRRP